MVSVEERELTADFLLAKPVGRNQILTSKLLAALTALAHHRYRRLDQQLCPAQHLQRWPDVSKPRPLLLLLLSIVAFQLFFLTVGW